MGRSTLGVFWPLIPALHVDDIRALMQLILESLASCIQVLLLGWSSRLRLSQEHVRTLSSGSTWPEWGLLEQRALERQEVAGTSLQDRLLQRLQQAAFGQRREHALLRGCHRERHQ